MGIRLVGQAIGLFAVTNIDDIVILALFFGQTTGRGAVLRVVAGQYLGFAAILAASIAGALGAGLLPESTIPYLGLLPLALGLRAAWSAWREHRAKRDHRARSQGLTDDSPPPAGAGVLSVASVTLANGGDNIGVYVPVFATADAGGLLTYIAVFLVLVAAWCWAGYLIARRPLIATTLAHWGHILLPIVLITLGMAILIQGHAFGL